MPENESSIKDITIVLSGSHGGWQYRITGITNEITAERFPYPIKAVQHALEMIRKPEQFKLILIYDTN